MSEKYHDVPSMWPEITVFLMILVFAVVVLIVATAASGSPSRVTRQYACIDLRTGRMNLDTGPRAYTYRCKPTETRVSWEVRG